MHYCINVTRYRYRYVTFLITAFASVHSPGHQVKQLVANVQDIDQVAQEHYQTNLPVDKGDEVGEDPVCPPGVLPKLRRRSLQGTATA